MRNHLPNCISLVVPAYNEQGAIADVIERVLESRSELAKSGFSLQLIVVDDGRTMRRRASRVHIPICD
jgi:glycosyltransferase involved in cell wall biosynthesis